MGRMTGKKGVEKAGFEKATTFHLLGQFCEQRGGDQFLGYGQ